MIRESVEVEKGLAASESLSQPKPRGHELARKFDKTVAHFLTRYSAFVLCPDFDSSKKTEAGETSRDKRKEKTGLQHPKDPGHAPGQRNGHLFICNTCSTFS